MEGVKRKTYSAAGVPPAVGPYSHAVSGGGLLFLSGQIPLNPETGALEGKDLAGQTEMVLTAVRRVLESAGSGLELVVKVTVFMVDLGEFETMNSVYSQFFPHEPPARSVVGVAALPKGAEIEVEVVALKG